MMKDHLTAPQYVMYQDLKRWLKHEARCKPSMERDASQARLIRGLQRLMGLAVVRCEEWIVQAAVQAATEKALKLAVIVQARLKYEAYHKERETKRQKVRDEKAQKQEILVCSKERETKRQKVRDEKEESGVGFSVEQLEFNRGIPGNATQLEVHKDDYYYGPYCSDVTHPEDLEHHAGEIAYAYTWYDWVTNKLICPVDACLPPVMTCVTVTDAQHVKLMEDMRHTSEQAFCHSTKGIPCCNKT